MDTPKRVIYAFAAVLCLALLTIGTFAERYQSSVLLFAFTACFLSYIFLVKQSDDTKFLFRLGIILRLVLFVSLPSLSDDIYRFIWDGTLLKNGIHPFENLPSFYLDKNIPGLSTELYDKLNSPAYFTIYPPLNQFVFWVATIIGGGSWLVSTNVIRVLLLAADIGSFYFLGKLLEKYGKSSHLAFWYFLNPLVILEFVGNVHFEGFVIFFLLAGIYWYETSKKWFSATALGLAIGAKLLPYIYLPFLFLKGLKERKWMIALMAGVVSVITLLPMLNEHFINGMQDSLDLYFRKFEFNASLYFIAREIGFWIYGYNKIASIGPLLSILALISILAISVVGMLKKWSIPQTLLLVLSVYLLFATTVHPWYILPLVAFGVLSGYYFPMVWSFLIFLTYLGYSTTGFELPMYIVWIEYALLGLAVFVELRLKRVNRS